MNYLDRIKNVGSMIKWFIAKSYGMALPFFISEVQLKPHHKPYELRRNWAELLEKFATSELESRKKDDEPVLYFRRNVQLSETREQQIVTFCSNALDMLLTDARSSLFLDRCPMFPENAAELAGLGFAMEDGAYDCKTHNVDWLRVHIDDQLPVRIADVIRSFLIFSFADHNGYSELEIRIIEWWKKGTGVKEVRRQYLAKLRESTPCYG
uniref:FERM domain-containing protein 8 n=1 Tax=Angiostrongylus cantonensis TaxID=6313 RepID=A0A0K0DDL2_ANGCA